MSNGIPFLSVKGVSLPFTWEESIKKLLADGKEAPSQYDRAGDPLTRDCTMVIDTINPTQESMIHSFMPGGPIDLQEYCMEVMDGVKDHWVRDPKNLNDHRWSYTYHGRITKDFGVNQIDQIVKKLIAQPFTRQAQFTTWMPATDPIDYDPPCLQRGWCRILKNVNTGQLEFTSHITFRSRDALKAAFMNTFAFVRLFDERIRMPIEAALGVPILYARHVDFSDSYHIYGKDLKDIPAFMHCAGKYYNYKEDWKSMMEEYIPEIMDKIRKQDEQRKA